MADAVADIRQALRTALLATPDLPAARDIEGFRFVPVVGVPWIREKLFPVPKKPITLGPNPLERHSGLYVVDVFVPTGQGNGACDLLTGTIAAQFPLGTPLLFGDQRVTIEFAGRGTPTRERAFLTAPVTISWHSDTA